MYEDRDGRQRRFSARALDELEALMREQYGMEECDRDELEELGLFLAGILRASLDTRRRPPRCPGSRTSRRATRFPRTKESAGSACAVTTCGRTGQGSSAATATGSYLE